MGLRVVARLAAAVALTATAGFVTLAGPAPAEAAACTSSSGVTVVADFNDLGGGVPSVCLADGAGRPASQLFPEAGLPLTYAQRQPGFVCRVSGVPASDPCVNTSPTSAYWGLWWSDGDPGSRWTYSSLGAGSLSIPAGGLVALSWDDVSGDAQPGAPSERPPGATTTPGPTQGPTKGPTKGPTQAPTTAAPGTHHGDGGPGAVSSTPATSVPSTPASSSSAPASERPSASPTTTAHPHHHASRTPQTPAPTVTSGATPAGSATDVPVPAVAPPVDDGGLPGWVAPVVVLLLFAGSGGALLWRNGRGGRGRRGTP